MRVAFAVFAAAVMFAWDLSHPDEGPSPPSRRRRPVDLASELPEGWSELRLHPRFAAGPRPPGPDTSCSSGAGTSMGETRIPRADGFVFDVVTRRWEPSLPHRSRVARTRRSAWTGSGAADLGRVGRRVPRRAPYFGDGAAFDPATGTWRMLPRRPIEARAAFSVWTGDGADRLGKHGEDRASPRRCGVRPDHEHVADDRRRPDRASRTASAVWTGNEMIVFGAALDGSNRAGDARPRSAPRTIPAADTWRALPPPELSPEREDRELARRRVDRLGLRPASGGIRPDRRRVASPGDRPARFSECRPESVATTWHGVRRVLREDRRDLGGRRRVAADPDTAPERPDGRLLFDARARRRRGR